MRSKTNGCLVIEPNLRVFSPESGIESSLYLNAINILTIIPKWMPKIKHWHSFFQSFAATSYNMVHFAPVNTRGVSNSPYAIYDQLSLSDDIFEENLTEDEKESRLCEEIKNINRNCGILSISDIVWNHTACNSYWLNFHPEAGYNLKTAPYLRSAFELDESLLKFSSDLNSYQLTNDPQSEQEMSNIVAVFLNNCLPKLELWQFYVIDVKALLIEFRESWNVKWSQFTCAPNPKQSKYVLQELVKDLKIAAFYDPKTFKRFSKTLDINKATDWMNLTCKNYGIVDFEEQMIFFQSLIDEMNLPFYLEWDDDFLAIQTGLHSRANFLRFDQSGPKLGVIDELSPIVDTYFTRLSPLECNATQDELCLANNGWIWAGDPLCNFAGPESKAYLRREVIAWGDCVKLRYGECVEDNVTAFSL